jgi:hypothetical protein
MKPHKHAKEIKAWADGAEIEFYVKEDDIWRPTCSPSWGGAVEYRIKPQPKPDFVWFWGFNDKLGDAGYLVKNKFAIDPWPHQLKITIDGETGKTKSAEVLK